MPRRQRLPAACGNLSFFVVLAFVTAVGCGRDGPQPLAPPATSIAAADPADSAPGITPDDLGLDFAWIPGEAELVIQVRIDALSKSPLLERIQQSMGSVMLPIGTSSPPGVDTFTIALDDVGQFLDQAGSSNVPAGMMLTLLRTFAPVDMERLKADPDLERVPENTCPMFRRRDDSRSDLPEMLAVPEPNILVTGSEDQVRRALLAGAQQARPAAAGRQHAGQLLVWGRLKHGAEFPQRLAQLLPKQLQTIVQQVADTDGIFSLQLDLSESMNLSLKVQCPTADQAQAMQQHLQSLVPELKLLVDDSLTLPGTMRTAADLALANLKASRNGATAQLDLHILEQSLHDILQVGLQSQAASSPQAILPVFTPLKSPGELRSESVPASRATGVPPGSQLIAAVRWAELIPVTAAEAAMPPALDVVIQAVDGMAANVVTIGNVHVTRAVLDNDIVLKRRAFDFIEPARQSEQQLIRSEMFHQQPEGSAAFAIPFHHPAMPATAVRELEGAWTLGVAERIQDKHVPNLRDWLEQPVSDVDLRAAGLHLKLQQNDGPEAAPSICLTLDPGNVLLELAVGDPGTPLEQNAFVKSELLPRGRSQYLIHFFGGPLPDPIPIRCQLASQVTDQRMTFYFQNLAIPSLPVETVTGLKPFVWKPSSAETPSLENVRVEGRIRWSQSLMFDDSGNSPVRPLELAIDVTGEAAQRAIAFGHLQLKEAVSDNGAMVLRSGGSPFASEALIKLIAVDRGFAFADYPPDGIQVVFSFDPPTTAATADISGQFTMVTAMSQHDVILNQVATTRDTPVSHPELDAAGVRLKLLRFENNVTVSLTAGSPEVVQNIVMTDRRGDPLPGVFGARSSFGGAIEFSFQSAQVFPEEVQLVVTLNSGLVQHTVPFRFEDLAIPAVPPMDSGPNF